MQLQQSVPLDLLLLLMASITPKSSVDAEA